MSKLQSPGWCLGWAKAFLALWAVRPARSTEEVVDVSWAGVEMDATHFAKILNRQNLIESPSDQRTTDNFPEFRLRLECADCEFLRANP
jgi:hypothetical protein